MGGGSARQGACVLGVRQLRELAHGAAIFERAQAERTERAQAGRLAREQVREQRARRGLVQPRDRVGSGQHHRVGLIGADVPVGCEQLAQARQGLLVVQTAECEHGAGAQAGIGVARCVREQRRRGARVGDVHEQRDGDDLLRIACVGQRIEQRLDGAFAELAQGRARLGGLCRVGALGAVHDRVGHRAVHFDQQPAIERPLGVVQRQRQEVALERIERASTEVHLHAEAGRLHHQLFVGRGAHHAAQELVGFVDRAAAEQELGELEVNREQPFVLGDGLTELGDRARGVLALAVHLAELLVTVGVVGAELHRARRVTDGVVVAVKLGGVLGHTLVVLARALRVELGQLFEHFDGVGQTVLQHEYPLAPLERLDVARRELGQTPQHALGVHVVGQPHISFGEQPARLEIRRLGREASLEPARALAQLTAQAPQRHDVLARLARKVAARSRVAQQLLPDLVRLVVQRLLLFASRRGAAHALERQRVRLLVAQLLGLQLRRFAQRLERLFRHVVLEVDLAEQEQALRAIGDHGAQPLPGRHGALLVARLPVARAELDQMLRIGRAAASEPLQESQAAVALADPLVEIDQRRQRLFVVTRARLELAELGHGAGALAALNQRFCEAKDVVGVARRGADQGLVFADRLVERALDFEQLHDFQPRCDVARIAAEHLAIGRERLVDAPGFFVERGQESQLVGVERALFFEARDEFGQAIVLAVNLGHRLVHFAAHARRLTGDADRLFELGQRLLLVTAASQRQAEVAQRRREHAVIARGRLDDFAELVSREVVFAARQKLATELGTYEKRALGAAHELALVLLGGVVIVDVERQRDQRAQHHLLFGAVRHVG